MSDKQTEPETPQAEPALHGLLAEYENPQSLLEASRKVRDAGYTRWDTYTPFPVHGIESAMGIRMTILPWLVLVAGITGCVTGIVMQWWMNAVDYPWIVSGKPFWSLPANIPVIFELTILFSAITALVGMLVMNGLPHPSHPLDFKRRFARATDDRFFLLIQANDPKFDDGETRELLEETAPTVLDELAEDRITQEKLPMGLVYALIIVGVAALVPFALIAQARETKTEDPRVHAIGDMDWQPKFKTQRENILFADDRSMRKPVAGTIPHGELRDDKHLYEGKVGDAWARTLPRQVPPTEETMARGQERFDIFCAPCHGLEGDGQGMITLRAQDKNLGFLPPTSLDLHQERLRYTRAGELFDIISHGIRNMPPYASQIEPEDRWAIVMYVRALQRSRSTEVADLPLTERSKLK